MTFSTKERLAIKEAIHAMKWLDKHHDGWGLEDECAILENICSNCEENEIKSNHNYLDLQYQIDGAESEIERLRDEIKILKLGEKAATVDKDVLKSILMDIANIVGKVSIAANCGGDFDPNDCDVNTCEYFYDCVRQKALLQKIEKL